MHTLLFDKPEFHPGANITVRAGSKWADRVKARDVVRLCEVGHEEVPLGYGEVVEVITCPLEAISGALLLLEHDPTCRTRDGLRASLDACYGTDWDRRYLTVIMFVPFMPPHF